MDRKKFSEDSRVKIPAILHFKRIGYTYQTKKVKADEIDKRNNIFVSIFKKSIEKINDKEFTDAKIEELLKEIYNLTNNSIDKGESFFDRLTLGNSIKLIDLETPENNDFRVVSELPFYGDRINFRPDITILINGIPLSFMEVKKPNNKGYTNRKGVTKYGIQAEFNRMGDRFAESSYTPYFNQMQILTFSNNQKYDDGTQEPFQGSFYTTPNWDKTTYNHFREEREIAVSEYLSDDFIDEVLTDNNISSIRSDVEFNDNLKTDTPTNSFITSVYSPERIIFFIRFGIVYVNSQRDGLNKHIIRYPQYFALRNLTERIDAGKKRTVLWHTQGSGKTAFAYFATNVLRDYYRKKRIITKFYFVVDRLDLLTQASTEFADRGMSIAPIESKLDFAKNIESPSITGKSSQRGKYKETMNVVNIQKFSEQSKVDMHGMKGIQRIYFIDEVHRGYKDDGVFLANLLGADKNGIYIGLTGTPILSKTKTDDKGNMEKTKLGTTDIFQDYLHKYYYNKSIADGYTLKIKKESIATKFKNDVRSILNLKEDEDVSPTKWESITNSDEFVNQLCAYIDKDYQEFRKIQKNDNSLGFMIVTTGSEQAEKIQKWFNDNSTLKTCLVLYDEDDNSGKQKAFKGTKNKETGKLESPYDGMIVFQMCITGFDAPRLKRLYLLRTIKEHSLLQTLARVNRPYKKMQYGYIVDFVDITEQYEETNRRYLEELKKDIADEDDLTDVSDMFVDVEKVKATVKELENKLFTYMYNIESNLEDFSKQIQLLDETTLRTIRGYIEEYRVCYNELRMSHENTDNIPIDGLNKALTEVSNRIAILVAARTLEDDDEEDEFDFSQLIVEFLRNGEMDLDFTTENDVLEIVNKIQNAFSANTDKGDKAYRDLYKRYKELIKKFKNETDTASKVKAVLTELDGLYNQILILNDQNNSLTNRYKGDETCMRVHKKFRIRYAEQFNEVQIFEIITKIKGAMDEEVGHMPDPTKAVIIRKMLNHIRIIYKEYEIKVNARMAEDIIVLFVEDKYKD